MNAICMKSYEIENIHFDKGYVEEVQKGERFSPNDYWRVATDKEVIDFLNTPDYKRPKGRYFV
ncbi:MAG: hypothetical protein LBG15_07245 [Dysgonamonadaceae bacterium]|jgi:hypothetical protein|nr:hypothetical protein [Dysgonamonadaceae bacterium]